MLINFLKNNQTDTLSDSTKNLMTWLNKMSFVCVKNVVYKKKQIYMYVCVCLFICKFYINSLSDPFDYKWMYINWPKARFLHYIFFLTTSVFINVFKCEYICI